MFEYCKKKEVNRIILEVSKENKGAKKFYDNLGFKTFGLRRNFYKDGSDAISKEIKLIKK